MSVHGSKQLFNFGSGVGAVPSSGISRHAGGCPAPAVQRNVCSSGFHLLLRVEGGSGLFQAYAEYRAAQQNGGWVGDTVYWILAHVLA
jgi:hypothetical protein